MKAAIHNPYLDTLGGGERYTLAVGRALSECGYDVYLEWKDKEIVKKLEDRFGLKLKNINIVQDIRRGDGYDFCFWVSDGSIPTLLARRNILHFQVPFHDVGGKSLLNKMKLFRINKIVCNSTFTKKIIDKEFGVESIVVYPPVDVSNFKPKRKENLIVFVGRFSRLLQSKGQDVLVRAFRRFLREKKEGWRLILAGGTEVGVGDFLKRLTLFSSGGGVEIVESPTFSQLKDIYGRAKFYWSASGFGVNPKTHPERLEHFGITVVEAMAAGAIPFVFDAGGGREIIDDGKDGVLWKNIPELVGKSILLSNNKKMVRQMSKSARQKASQFSYEKFKQEISSIF